MPRPSKSRWFAIGLTALVLIGCQPEEVGTVGPEAPPDDAAVADPDVPAKGKGKGAVVPVTRESRK
ncbi:hypothetical protein [Paludisphaera soli]|uniref:hypothetical protein n=1 Tax=Paludisphaera soli TaxID=2712865 RepID=UPI0013E9D391|nr:hypothetical protein [Paludisphaera soli]